jgi:hypothetical protein
MYQCEAGTLVAVFALFDIIRTATGGSVVNMLESSPLLLGRRLCLAYETYLELHAQAVRHLSFERAWSLLRALISGEELVLMACRECQGLYVHHLLEVDPGRCACCKLTGRAPLRHERLPSISRRGAPSRPPFRARGCGFPRRTPRAPGCDTTSVGRRIGP